MGNRSAESCLAVLLAGGASRRFGADKLREEIAGRAVADLALAALIASPAVSAIQIVGSPDNLAWLGQIADRSGSDKLLPPCKGGDCRSISTLSGLEAAAGDWEWALVHDAARPFLTPRLIDDGLAAASRHGAVIAALRATDTVQIVDGGGRIVQSPDRARSYLAQTPQIAKRQLLLQCHRRLRGELDRFTDEASLLRHCGHPVAVYEGAETNLKITSQGDLAQARAIHPDHQHAKRSG